MLHVRVHGYESLPVHEHICVCVGGVVCGWGDVFNTCICSMTKGMHEVISAINLER